MAARLLSCADAAKVSLLHDFPSLDKTVACSLLQSNLSLEVFEACSKVSNRSRFKA